MSFFAKMGSDVITFVALPPGGEWGGGGGSQKSEKIEEIVPNGGGVSGSARSVPCHGKEREASANRNSSWEDISPKMRLGKLRGTKKGRGEF